MQQWAPPSNGEGWDEQRQAQWRAEPASQSIAEQERMHWMASARQHPPMDHQHQQERPSVARAHSFPPPLQPSASSSSSSVRPSASSPASGSHPNAYHPYASSPKKPLLFINTVPPTDASVSTKPKRKRIMPEQLKELCALFDITDSPSFDAREKVGQAVGMTNREVQVWFQNRRAKVNRERAAAQEAKQARPTSAPREGPPPLSSFTSRFSAATDEQQASGVGEHTWRYRHTPRSVPIPSDAPEGVESAFRLPPLPEPAPLGPLPAPPRPPLTSRRSHPGPPPGRQFYEQPAGHGVVMPSPQPSYLLPSPQPSYRSPPTSHYSPSSFTPSFFGMTSPSISSSHGSTGSQMFTPNPGSAYSASSGGYFSQPEGPYSPGNNFSSPSGTFLRLSLDSPHGGSAYSPRSNAGSFEQSPIPPSDPPIHLPPIVSPRMWNVSQGFNDREQRERDHEVQRARQRDMDRGHHRSQSEGTATDAMRIAPLRGSVEPPRPSSSSSRPNPSVSLPASPENAQSVPLHLSPARPGGSHLSSSPHLNKSVEQHPQQQQQRRMTYPHPSSLAHTSARVDEPEGGMGPPSGPGGVGLGMLAMAGEMVEDEETETEKEARERYTATRKLSYNALREQPPSSAEGGADSNDAEMGGM